MSEFDGIENTGVKAMRETIDRKNEEIAKLQAELHEHKDAKLNTVVKQIGLNPDNGFGKALKQVYNGDATVEQEQRFTSDSQVHSASIQITKHTGTVRGHQDSVQSRVPHRKELHQ